MTPKQMRAKLKESGLSVPRSNEGVKALYKATFKTKPEEKKKTALKVVPAGNQYTYIGQGHEPPERIKFMGKVFFKRGDLVTITDPDVLEKVKNNPCFVKGAYPNEKLYENDQKAEKHVEAVKDLYKEQQRFMDKKNRGNES